MRYFRFLLVLLLLTPMLTFSTVFATARYEENVKPEDTSDQFFENPIPCQLHVDDPHLSYHEPGKVNVIAWVKCAGVVSEVKMAITLRRDGEELGTSYFVDINKSSVKHSMATPCISGLYQGRLFATVTPPSTTMKKSSGYAFSNQKYIQCP